MKRKSHCQQCGRCDNEVGRISRRGLCAECGQANARANAEALANKSGPAYNLWLKRQTQGYALHMERVNAELDQRYRAAESAQQPA